MAPNLTEILANDLASRTGIKAAAASSLSEALDNIRPSLDSLPMVQLFSATVPFLEPLTYEAHTSNGTTKQVPYDIDHIPAEITVVTCALGKTSEEVEDLASAIRSTYTDTADAGILNIPVDSDGTFVTGKYGVKQLRSAPAEYEAFFGTFINPTAGIKVPIPYLEEDLNASFSDRDATIRLLLAYYYYMYILESRISTWISNGYSALFKEKGGLVKGKLAGGKKALFKKLRENEAIASALDSNIAQNFTGETIGNLADDFRAGRMDRDEFETYFSRILPIIPDLYDRAMRHEPVDTVLAEATAKEAELQRRANAIADSLGIEENTGESIHYTPRSFEAATIYVQTLGIDQDATMQDALAAYRMAAGEKEVNAQARQDSLNNMVMGAFTAATAANIAGKAEKRRESRQKPDLLGSAGCEKNKGTIGGCSICALRSDCARG